MPTSRPDTSRPEQQEERYPLTTEDIVKRPFEPDPDALPTRNRLDDLGRAAT